MPIIKLLVIKEKLTLMSSPIIRLVSSPACERIHRLFLKSHWPSHLFDSTDGPPQALGSSALLPVCLPPEAVAGFLKNLFLL